MLRISRSSSVEYYLRLEYEERRAQGEEANSRGQWATAGAVALKLLGEVAPAALEQVLRGRNPHTGRPLVQNADSPKRQCGIDLTFHAPKSLSVFWALTPEAREVVLECKRNATATAVEFFESQCCFARRGKAGAKIERAYGVAATFEHTLSRANDPLLHDHVVFANLSVREDGTVGALYNRAIFDAQKAGNSVYLLALATQISEKLGLELVPTKNGFELADVPKRLLIGFSKRSEEIKAHLREDASFKAKDTVALMTRPEKSAALDRDKQFDVWAAEAAEMGWSRDGWPTPDSGRGVSQEEMLKLAKDYDESLARRSQAKHVSQHWLFPEEERLKRLAFDEAHSERELERKEEPVKLYDTLDMATQGRARKPGWEKRRQVSLTTSWRRVMLKLIAAIALHGGVVTRINEERLFPKAPTWSPASRLTKEKIRIGRYPYGVTRWRVNLTRDISVFVPDKYFFPKAPRWSPVRNWKLPAVHVSANEQNH